MPRCAGPPYVVVSDVIYFFQSGGLSPAAVILAMLLMCPAAAQAQAILALEVVEPRAFGYVIGDTLRREVHLSLRAEYHLENASLPKAGRLNRWLELAPPEIRAEPIEDGRRRYRLIFAYQILNAPRQLETITLPQLNLGFTDGTQPLTTLVPALPITVTPLTPEAGPDSFGLSSLQPDRAPAPIPVEARERRFSWIVAGLLSLLAYAAARRWLMPLFAAGKLPFATAVRELKRSQRETNTPAQYADGLRIVHQAVNETAGRVVFAANLDEFFEAHPRFADLRTEFARVFAASRKVFFADADGATPSDGSLPALLLLCRQCSRIERKTLRLRP